MRNVPEIKALLSRRGIQCRIDKSVKSGDTLRLAKQAKDDGIECIVAVGGDGTFFEVVNGIGMSDIEIIFAPCGTGNDFMRMFALPKDVLEAVRLQLDSPVRRIDMGKCNDTFFLNVAGTGFDVDVLVEAERFKAKYTGLRAYLCGAFNAIKNLKTLTGTIAIDGSDEEPLQATIISIGNGRYIGGGMLAVPMAKPDDGFFDLVICKKISKLRLPILLMLFVMGRHTKKKSLVRYVRCKNVHIKSSGMIIEADGEMFHCDDANFSIVPGALATRLPELK